MSGKEKLRISIVGACNRGRSFAPALHATGEAHIVAVCDINEKGLEKARADLGADEAYTDYEQMLRDADINTVIVGTPMPLHVPQAVAALELDYHVLSEVPAGVSIDECRDLVRAANAADACYMMAENYTYIRQNMTVAELVRRGLFGTTYYAEGEYLHDCRELYVLTPWRRRWGVGVNGITYGTHSLGPVLKWMPGERVTEVCCAGAGRHRVDAEGKDYEQEDTCVMLGKTTNGGLVKIRMDILSDRPHAMANYVLQGTEGAYESARAQGEPDRIWLREVHGTPHKWHDLLDLPDEFTPQAWVEHGERAREAGHGGGDYLEVLDFVEACLGRKPPPIGIHETMDMCLPGLVSQQSIEQGGAWLPVPDSRDW